MISLAYHKHEEIFGGIIKACKNKLKTKQNKTTTKKKNKKQSKNKVQSTNQQWNPVKKNNQNDKKYNAEQYKNIYNQISIHKN